MLKLFHFVTGILILLKACNFIQVSWFMVFLPSLISVSASILIMLLVIISAILIGGK